MVEKAEAAGEGGVEKQGARLCWLKREVRAIKGQGEGREDVNARREEQLLGSWKFEKSVHC